MGQTDLAASPRHGASTDFARRAARPLFAATALLGAGLVFLIQPMFTKMVLPLTGGGAGVWNIALFFFQGALLLGYLYANALAERLSLKGQVVLHLGALAAVGFTLPIGIAAGFETPLESGAPQLWLIVLFAASVGAPYLLVSATAPLLQAWFARAGISAVGEPYRLYIASNCGSLGALLAYPLLVEPAIGAVSQSLLWSGLYGILAASIGACGVAALVLVGPRDAAPAASAATKFRAREGLRWAMLAAPPSALLVAATTHLSIDVAPTPLLWVAPLAVYLLAYIAAFAQKTAPSRQAALLLHAVFVALAMALLVKPSTLLVDVLVTLCALFMCAFVCLRALYEARPEAARLTSFYVFASLGGVLGGSAAALLAPVLFDGVWEYPLALVASLFARPLIGGARRPIADGLSLAALTGFVAIFVLGRAGVVEVREIHQYVAFLLAGAAILLTHATRRLMIAAAGVIALVACVLPDVNVLAVDRGFYGVAKVVDFEGYRVFTHGTTIHGVQSRDPKAARIPHSYYGPQTPIGDVFTQMNEQHRVASVALLGVGAGATACYAKPGQSWLMVEIDPIVARMAQDPALFTYISDCAPDARLVIRDARLALAKEPGSLYDIIVVDAFSSDSIPTHLLTREAMEMYLSRLSPDGVIVVHISNRALDLSAVVARAARAAGADALLNRFPAPKIEAERWRNFGSEVVIVGRMDKALDPFRGRGGWTEIKADGRRPWTDDYTNLFEAIAARFAGD